MANRNFYNRVFTPSAGTVLIAGTVSHGAGGVATGDTVPHVSASYVSTGIHRLTFEDAYAAHLATELTLEYTGTIDIRCQVSGVNLTNAAVGHQPAQTIDYLIMSGQVAYNPQSPFKVHVLSFLKNSGV